MAAHNTSALLAADASLLWHPYSNATHPTTTRLVASAYGSRLNLRDTDGSERNVVDAMSSWWCAIHGYNVPELNAAAQQQLEKMSHVMFGGLTHEPAVRLAETLAQIAPHPEPDREALTRVFLADSGSVSIEIALKMALQMFAADARPRRRILTVRGGYHGDTLHPMSVCDPNGGMHTLWRGTLPEQLFAPRPPAGRGPDLAADPDELAQWKQETRSLFEEYADDIAAVIVEPLLQGAGGMHIYDPQCVRFLAALAREHGACVIFDEIATGFGRTGTYWAADRIGITPDIMCIGKALTGGYLTMAAALCTEHVATTISERTGAVMHGPTFMGNPLSCAIASASVELLDTARLEQAAGFETTLASGLEPLRALPHVLDVRTIGAVGVVQLAHDVDVEAATAAALDAGAWIRPFRDLIYTMPPFVCSPDDLTTIIDAVTAAVKTCVGAPDEAATR